MNLLEITGINVTAKINDKVIAQHIAIEISLNNCPASTFNINSGIKTKTVVNDDKKISEWIRTDFQEFISQL